jgi:hypothetical protein
MRQNVDVCSRGEFVRRAGMFMAAFGIGRMPNWMGPAFSAEFPHPEPREGITAERVLSVETLGPDRSKRVMEAYEAARTYPQILDGLFCACHCGGKSGHRSLLVCYETLQPTGCGACQGEAELAGKLAKQEKTLAEIRAAVDKAYHG